MNKKNVIILMIDGGRPDYAKNSKVFENLKNKSNFFSQSITYAPHTIASMHAVFSGCYGSRNGTDSYWSTFQFKKDKFKTLTQYLKENNYYTYADVINQLVVPKQGFDKFIIHDEEKDDLLKRHRNLIHDMNDLTKKQENFFLYLHYSNIHTGIMNEVLKVYNNFSEEFFNNQEKNKERYLKLFNDAENYLEGMLDEIFQLGLHQNSIILVMSDHGISIGEKIGERAYGAFCYDYTLKTITNFIFPNLPSNKISQQVRTIDFMPTILDYLEISFDKTFSKMDGVSLIPLIQGKSIPELNAFSETGNPLKEKAPPKTPNVKSIRTPNWKLIFNEYDDSKELYDLKTDPHEKNNLISTGINIENDLWVKLKKNIDNKD
jgi:arylsulfatase A-like enzyme